MHTCTHAQIHTDLQTYAGTRTHVHTCTRPYPHFKTHTGACVVLVREHIGTPMETDVRWTRYANTA